MKLFIINLAYEIIVEEEIPELIKLKYDKTTGEFIQIGQEGNHFKSDLIIIVAENEINLPEIIKHQMGKYGEEIIIEILDVIDLANVIKPEQTIPNEDGTTTVIPAVKGKLAFQGGFDIYKEELKTLLDDATSLLTEVGGL